MFHLDADLKEYLHREAVDFRKSINGLATLVEQSMGRDPFARAVYAFRNCGCDRIKLEEQFRLAQLKRYAPGRIWFSMHSPH
jgi:transposase